MIRRLVRLAALLFGLALSQHPALAQPALQVDCDSFAQAIARLAEYRDVGAPIERVIDFLQRSNPPGPMQRLVEIEARRVYAEGLPAEEAAFRAYLRCAERLGRVLEEG